MIRRFTQSHAAIRLAGGLLTLLLFSLPAEGADKRIRLRNRQIDTANIPAAAGPQQGLARPVGERLAGLRWIQFTGPVEPRWRTELAALGVELLHYVPEDAFLARFRDVDPGELATLDYVTWIGTVDTADKLMAGLSATGDETVRILVSDDAAASGLGNVRSLLSRVEGESRARFGTVLEGTIPAARLSILAGLDSVLWIEPASRMQLLDEVGAKLVGGDDGLVNTPTVVQALGYDGAGVTVAVADSGLSFGQSGFVHSDLSGRIDAFLHYGELSNAADGHGHGTHVAGILAGNAAVGEVDMNGYRFGLGMVPQSRLVVQRLFDDFGGYHPPASYAELTSDAVNAGAEIGSNSWGDGAHGRYDLSAMEFDALVRDADPATPGDQPYILSFSAGNAGPASQTIYSPAVAKNVIATGASQNDRRTFQLYADGPETMADFSSRGPCEDGRIKPDLVAPGTWMASARSALAPDDSFWGQISPQYGYMGGTSQAAPLTSGAAAAFVQFYREQTGGDTPSPALVKAALINAAVDMADDGGTAPVPNGDEGWGRLNLERLLVPPNRPEFVDQTVLLATGQHHEQRVLLENSGTQLKITLVYTDEPGFPGAIPALVNDLDLIVVAPDGRSYQGNQFQNGESIPDRLISDRINNVEAVHVSEPLPGEYVVRVVARNVAQDARRDTSEVDQDFALVISGALPPAGAGVIAFDRAAYTVPSTAGVRLVDVDLAGQGFVDVVVNSTTEPAGEPLRLEAADATGAFTNALALSTGSMEADGLLQVAHGDSIAVSYLDASPAATRTATARVDLVAPVVSGLEVTNRFGAVVITWDTDEPATTFLHYGTNQAFDVEVTSTVFATSHEVVLKGLVPDVVYEFMLVNEDEAGNVATNDNGGLGFTFTPEPVRTLLVVDAYTPDQLGAGTTDFPLSETTDPLDAIGIGYDVWTVSDQGSPLAEDLAAYPAVLWRFNDNPLSSDTLSIPDQTALSTYLDQGGSLFIAGMELLTRLGDVPFRRDVLQVTAFDEDAGVPSAVGVTLDPITDGLNLELDYTVFDSPILQFLGQTPDVADTITLTPDALPIFVEPGSGGAVGMRYPRPGVEHPGRVVYLSFPVEAIATNASPPNTRAELLRRAFQFLIPGAEGLATLSLDRLVYTLPSVVHLELGDTDLAGESTVTLQMHSDTQPAGVAVQLNETSRPGVFQGMINLTVATGSGDLEALPAAAGDRIWIEYADVSEETTLRAEAAIDLDPPSISGATVNPGFQSATVAWETSEPTDALVQLWESSADLPINRTFYRPEPTMDHTLVLSGLKPGRTYYFQVVVRDAAGNVTVDDNAGDRYSFQTQQPLVAPWSDDLEGDTSHWVVLSLEDSEVEWTAGMPVNGPVDLPHSGAVVWNSNLGGEARTYTQTFLQSPALYLDGGTAFTLSFWHAYDLSLSAGDILNHARLFIVPAETDTFVELRSFAGVTSDWEQVTVDLTPYLGQVIYLVWVYEIASFDVRPRPGWVIDDIAIQVDTAERGALQIDSNLAQGGATVTGIGHDFSAHQQGTVVLLSNLVLGDYAISFDEVPFYTKPGDVLVTLSNSTTLSVTGTYTFEDANTNLISDAWELDNFSEISESRDLTTDTDDDGASDYAEFVAGTDPINAVSQLTAPLPVFRPDGQLELTWPSVRSRNYRVEESSDLVTWTPYSDWIRAEGTLTVLLVPPPHTASNRMFRIQVQP
jgi:hypothetical protein